jgi:DNA-binding transcriptional LysR family regulator
MDIEDIRFFLMLARGQTLTDAAEGLRLPKSSASRGLARLEQELGVALLYRTSRKLILTDAGAQFVGHATRIVEQSDEAEATLDGLKKMPSGLLKVTAAVNPGQFLIAPLIHLFLDKHPQIALSLTLTSEKIDPISSGVDVAIRTDALENSSLIARRLGSAQLGLFSSAKYLALRGEPRTPEDLPTHTVLDLSGSSGVWDISNEARSARIEVVPRVWVNDTTTVKSVLVSGFGIGWLPTYMCREEVKDGRLVRILRDWTRADRDVHALFVHHRTISPKVRAFVDFIAEHFDLGE